MAIVKAIQSGVSLRNVMNYVKHKDKTDPELVRGVNCLAESAFDEFMITKEIYHKTDKRQYKHYALSFKGDEVSNEKALEIAERLTREFFPDYQTLLAVHPTDRERNNPNVHVHIVINSVSFVDGRKIRLARDFLQDVKDRSNELCREYGLSVIEKKTDEQTAEQGITTYNKNKYEVLTKAKHGNCKSYVLECYENVKQASSQAVSREDFMKIMLERGYDTVWDDRHKHVTFKDLEGNSVRASNLQKTFNEDFSKDGLMLQFENNAANLERSQEPPALSEDELKSLERREQMEQLLERIQGSNSLDTILRLTNQLDRLKRAENRYQNSKNPQQVQSITEQGRNYR